MNIPKTPEELFKTLRGLGIEFTTETHIPLFTTAAGAFIKEKIPGAHVKNLFLKTKKRDYYLVTMLDDKRLDLKVFTNELGLGSVSFASDVDLQKYMGVEPGHVTPLALINKSAKDVKVILDRDMMEFDVLNFHPLRNHMTTSISREGFLQFLEHAGHTPVVVTLPKLFLN